MLVTQKYIDEVSAKEWQIVDAIAKANYAKNPFKSISDRQYNIYVRLGRHYDPSDRALGLSIEYYKRMLNSTTGIAKLTLRQAVANNWSVNDLIANTAPPPAVKFTYLSKFACRTKYRTSWVTIVQDPVTLEKFCKIGSCILSIADVKAILQLLK